jgi:hypothetical protein
LVENLSVHLVKIYVSNYQRPFSSQQTVWKKYMFSTPKALFCLALRNTSWVNKHQAYLRVDVLCSCCTT